MHRHDTIKPMDTLQRFIPPPQLCATISLLFSLSVDILGRSPHKNIDDEKALSLKLKKLKERKRLLQLKREIANEEKEISNIEKHRLEENSKLNPNEELELQKSPLSSVQGEKETKKSLTEERRIYATWYSSFFYASIPVHSEVLFENISFYENKRKYSNVAGLGIGASSYSRRMFFSLELSIYLKKMKDITETKDGNDEVARVLSNAKIQPILWPIFNIGIIGYQKKFRLISYVGIGLSYNYFELPSSHNIYNDIYNDNYLYNDNYIGYVYQLGFRAESGKFFGEIIFRKNKSEFEGSYLSDDYLSDDDGVYSLERNIISGKFMLSQIILNFGLFF